MADAELSGQFQRRHVVLACVGGSCIARIQRVSGGLVASKTVPQVTLQWYWQVAHCHYSRPSRRNEVRDCITPQTGETNPPGQQW